ncbi:hypothetical protein [Methylobacterium aerolatum]|uniref:Uncharacterized protein n=1 Tax=Methylobacterium aerolatum TaxID=418708 RepID=A0ABU0I6G7_9HYPH|nr:hypothetical protein [Methylobacterium aerolatum]MDQ0449638.1 hypothetical protein [Methylobacterium aerolatum]GJD36074.1 hypothetical protein FMGBMHLM_2988 [Methylobacterium aerolatum]
MDWRGERPGDRPGVRQGHKIVRWIGAAKRRAARLSRGDAAERSLAEVISLAWADTFGRPARRHDGTSPGSGGVVLLFTPRS